MYRKIFNNKGYGLLDITVALGLFSFMILMVLSIFQSINEAQKTAISAQGIQENLRYSLEVMSKEIRQAVRSDSNCSFGGSNRIYNFSAVSFGGQPYNAFYFKKLNRSGQEVCVYYFIDHNRIRIHRRNETTNSVEADNYITSGKINITSFNFDIFDNLVSTAATSKIQPRINIRIGAEMAGGLNRYKQPILIQTSVSSRSYGDTVYIL
ncbi:MAG: hypothetical protein BWY51_00341 [Parcubacteria group bacterium ADurb.Bin316]|nr:MAG: hypothetical protein BWY51_00341 [Parcubacteria group bacterium ADurb.Bin316]HOZ56504.1 hypothetical protein [bacterium]